ncbi:MAG TPA: hypothetical protein VJZ71_13330 [Phycisphaerae bacterium]|nr:hypothetical protein [Phycisphaerae bacterium]
MQEFSKNRTSRFVARRPALVAACAVLLVGGGAFAAAGGIDLIKSLFVTVDIDGQAVQLELQPVGENTYEGSLDTEIADGRQASIRVKRVENSPNELNTQVHVNVSDDGTVTENESEVVIRKGLNVGADPNAVYSMDDIGEAQPAHEWTNASGQARSLYLIDTGDGKIGVFSVTVTAEGTANVRRLAHLPAEAGFDTAPDVSVDDKDMITLTWGGDEDRRVIKLIDRYSNNPADLANPLSLDTPDGEIKVKVHVEESPDEQ